MDNKTLYLKTKPSRLFFLTAVPGGISMLASSLYTLFDSVFVGKFLGTTAFAALGLAMPLVVINFAMADLIGVGSSVPISILLGMKKDDEANNYFTCASIMIVLTGFISGLILYFIAPLFMTFMGADGELAALGVKYVRVYAVFSPFITMMFAVDNFLRICGKIKTGMVLNVSMSLGTIVLETIFIIGLGWGIEGAALGACIAMFVCVAIGFLMFVGGRLQLKLRRPEFHAEIFRKIYQNGSPAFLTNVAGRVFSVVMNIMLMKFGGAEAVAVYGILMTLGGVAEQLLYGVLDSLQPAIGYNYGAGEIARVKSIEKCCLIASSVISIGCAVIIFAIPGVLAVPFLEDMSLLAMTEHALRIFSIAYLFKWINHAIGSFLMALEKPLGAMCISLSSAFAFPLVFIAVLYPLGLTGLWMNYVMTAVFASALAIIILLRMRKKLF